MNHIRVASVTDRNYVEMTGVLIASVSSQTHSRPVELFVFCNDLTESDKGKLHSCLMGDAKLTLIDVEEERSKVLSSLTATRHLTGSAYARIMIPDMLPDLDGRLLYLDCDIVVNSPLDELFELDLGGRPAGAVRNVVSAERLAQLNSGLRRPLDTPYFNSGVLLFDLTEWRRQGVTARAMDFAKGWEAENGDHDQAVLNYVLVGNWLELDVKWNSNPRFVSIDAAQALPLQHFFGKSKPTHREYPEDRRTIYDQYRALTPWANKRRSSQFERRLKKKFMRMNAAIKRALEPA